MSITKVNIVSSIGISTIRSTSFPHAVFASEEAKQIFWDRFTHCCKLYHFTPWITSLLNNHDHVVGYNKFGHDLKHLMQRLHGSVAKLVNDLPPERRSDFWRDIKGDVYFDGCIRDVKQCRAAYRYTRMQARRHGIMPDYERYPHTRVYIDLDVGVKRASELGAFLEGVPYKRYER